MLHPGPLSLADRVLALAGRSLAKAAADRGEVAYNLAGVLYRSGDWLLLSVPNALVRGYFQAMAEPGAELPPDSETGLLNAHISVMRPEELELIGGPDEVTERGKSFHYTTGRLVTLEPEGWPEMSRVWMLTVHSPELQALRRSYGLSGLPKDGRYAFHITLAVRRRGVLGRNERRKGGD